MNPPIAAVSSSTGTDAGLSIIRMSGEGTRNNLLRCLRFKIPLTDTVVERSVYLCDMVRPGSSEPVDIVTVIFYEKPRSYTGEDSAELICHGSRVLTQEILEILLSAGFSAAAPGEFTRRAFLNGKMDLVQAESVAALTRAGTRVAVRAAVRGLAGETSGRIDHLADQLTDILALVEANIDFSEDGIDLVDRNHIFDDLESIRRRLAELIQHADRARLLHRAIRVVLTGKPNVGKSTILNRLLGSDRAIVSSVPGTTRDIVDGQIEIDGVLFELMDTAGIQDTPESLDAEGVARGIRAAQTADILLFIMDSSSITDDDLRIAEALPEGKVIVPVLNKVDIPREHPTHPAVQRIQNIFGETSFVRTIGIQPDGAAVLRSILNDHGKKMVHVMGSALLYITERQAECLHRAQVALGRGCPSTAGGSFSEELIAADLREALDSFMEFTGRKTADDILDRIFSKFCIGK